MAVVGNGCVHFMYRYLWLFLSKNMDVLYTIEKASYCLIVTLENFGTATANNLDLYTKTDTRIFHPDVGFCVS